MSKEEYLKQLQKYLKKLPKQDYEDAMEYFIEYFEETDEAGAQELMTELGTPKEAARDLISNLLDKKIEEQEPVFGVEDKKVEKDKKQSKWNIFWIALLAIFAAPIGAPLVFSALVVLLSLVLLVYRPTLLNQPQAVRWGDASRVKYKISLATNTALAHFNARPQEIFTHKLDTSFVPIREIPSIYQSQVNCVNRWVIQILLNVFWCNFFFIILKPFQIHAVFLWLWFVLIFAACRQ